MRPQVAAMLVSGFAREGSNRTPVLRSALPQLTEALLHLHAALLDVAKLDYERGAGQVASRGDLLVLLTEHEAFAWLRPLSAAMAELDDAIDGDDAERIVGCLATLAELLASDPSFAPRYLDALQRSPEVILAHAHVRRQLGRARLVS